MPRSEEELEARDAKRDIGAELLASVRAVKQGKPGNVTVVPAAGRLPMTPASRGQR